MHPMKKNNLPGLFVVLMLAIACSQAPKANEKQEVKDSSSTEIISPKDSTNPFLKDGEEKTKYKNGIVKTLGNYKKGKRDGQWLCWYENGKQWSEDFFDNGIKNGPTKTWYENGKLRYEGQYKNDVKSGVWKFYDEDGTLQQTVDYSKR